MYARFVDTRDVSAFLDAKPAVVVKRKTEPRDAPLPYFFSHFRGILIVNKYSGRGITILLNAVILT